MPNTPEQKKIVINTGPIIALAAALDDLELLNSLYRAVHVPYEVAAEIGAKSKAAYAVEQFEAACGNHRSRNSETAAGPVCTG